MAEMGTRPLTYTALLAAGWHWARAGDDIPHLVRADRDVALCLRAVERRRRQPVSTGIRQLGCASCKRRAGVTAPNPRSAEPLDLPGRADRYPGE